MKVSAPSNWELVTPHKLVVLSLIKNYTDIVDGKHALYKRIIWQDGAISRRNMDRAILLWIHQPDGTLKSILKIVENCSKVLYSALCSAVKMLCNAANARCIEDFLLKCSNEFFISDDALLQNDSVIGLFCRRMILYYAQMPFCYLHTLHENLCKYCSSILLKTKKLQQKSVNFKKGLSIPMTSASADEMESCNSQQENMIGNDEMELESQSELDSRSSSESAEDSELKPSDLKTGLLRDDIDVHQVFTSVQAGSFFAEQAALINNKESMALAPNVLQVKINQMMKTNPQLTEAYYLTYLNSLRVKEYCGAIDALLLYFNLNLNENTSNPTNKAPNRSLTDNNTCQYAALNMALLHYYFGNKSAAMTSAKEAFILCNKVNDNVSLHHVVSLMYQLDPKNIKLPSLVERVKATKPLKLLALVASDIQRQTNDEAMNGKSPVQVTLQLISSQLLSHNICSVSLCHLGCLLKMYGKRTLASLTLQQSLTFQNSRFSTIGYSQKNSEEVTLAICHLIELVAEEGNIHASNEMMNHLKVRFPAGTQHAHLWQLFSLKLQHRNALLCRKFFECVHLEKEIEVYDELESVVANAHRMYANGDLESCYKILKNLLKNENDKDKNSALQPETICKIKLLLACSLCSDNDSSLALSYALEAFSTAKKNYLHQFIIDLNLIISQIQLQNGFKSIASNLLRSCSYECMTNGSLMQKSRYYLILVKCNLACMENCTLDFLKQSCMMLKKAKKGFEILQDVSLKKVTVYMLAHLYNAKLDLLTDRKFVKSEGYNRALDQRNSYSLSFIQLDQATLHHTPNIF